MGNATPQCATDPRLNGDTQRPQIVSGVLFDNINSVKMQYNYQKRDLRNL